MRILWHPPASYPYQNHSNVLFLAGGSGVKVQWFRTMSLGIFKKDECWGCCSNDGNDDHNDDHNDDCDHER